MATDTMKAATRDGVTLRYVDAGAGEPAIVWVHGWCCNNTHFRDQVPHFAASRRCIGLDQRGHGASDKPDQDYSVAGFVDDLAWLIGELGLDRPVVAGHSMGGTVALNFARKHPGLTRGIVMVDSPIAPLPEPIQPMVGQMLAGLQSPAYAAVAEGFARMQFFNAESPPDLVAEVCASIPANNQRVMRTAIASTLDAASIEPGSIPVPALFIRAATSYAAEDVFRERYPGLEVTSLPAAHFVQMEKPAETNALIEAFLEKLA